jgi:hypothetical protein
VVRQFDVRVVDTSQPRRSQVETLITGSNLPQLFFAGIDWYGAFEQPAVPVAEAWLQFASFHEDCLCVSNDFRTLFYFDYHHWFHDTNNVFSWSCQDAFFLEAVLFLLRVDMAFG